MSSTGLLATLLRRKIIPDQDYTRVPIVFTHTPNIRKFSMIPWGTE